jgi:hypothetical protein
MRVLPRLRQVSPNLKRKFALPDNYVSIKVAAHISGVSQQTIYRPGRSAESLRKFPLRLPVVF